MPDIQASVILDPAEFSFFSDLRIRLSRKPVKIARNLMLICGADARYDEVGKNVVAVASLFRGGRFLESSCYTGKFTFPYISGLFYLHEGPFVIAAIKKLRRRPQLTCFDAHGAAHSDGRGLATICGKVLGIPSIGIAKTLLTGSIKSYKENLGKITYRDKEVGFVTRRIKKYWSYGYSVSLKELEVILEKHGVVCAETLHQAHKLTKLITPQG